LSDTSWKVSPSANDEPRINADREKGEKLKGEREKDRGGARSLISPHPFPFAPFPLCLMPAAV
jgi:hypothetical protein